MKAICAMFVLVGLLATRAAPPANAAAGDLDLTFAGFGNGGRVITPSTGSGQAMTLQPDGKIVVAGGSPRLVVMRFLPNGVPDGTFGAKGFVVVSHGQQVLEGTGVAIQADGKIVVAGTIERSDFLLVRLTSTGMVDDSFGDHGFVTTNFEDIISTDPDVSIDEAHAVLIQPDGKIVAAGKARISEWLPDYDFAAARYNPDGSLDPTFGGDGKVTIDFAGFLFFSGDDECNDIALQDDGKLVLVGSNVGLGDTVLPSHV